MTTVDDPGQMIFESSEPMDPLTESEDAQVKNRAKVGSARPSSLLYTYGVGSIMDLPQFSIMPAGLDDWEPIWRRPWAGRKPGDPLAGRDCPLFRAWSGRRSGVAPLHA